MDAQVNLFSGVKIHTSLVRNSIEICHIYFIKSSNQIIHENINK